MRILVSILLSSAISSPAFAQSVVPSRLPKQTPGAVKLDFNAAQNVKETDINCLTSEVPTNEQFVERILKNRDQDLQTQTIDGVEFRDQNALLLKALNILTLDKDGKPTGALAKALPSQDTAHPEVIPAAQALFGKREGLQILFLFLRYGINASHLQDPESSPWKAEELDSILLALKDLPPSITRLPWSAYEREKGFQKLIHAPRSVTLKNKDEKVTYANSLMIFFEAWSSASPLRRRTTAFHEFGHNIQEIIKVPDPWISLSPWSIPEQNVSMAKGVKELIEPFVSIYAKQSFLEDFAESFVAYRYTPKWLLERNPLKYAYMREVVFDGIEYLSKESCQNPERLSGKESPLLKAALQTFKDELLSVGASGPKIGEATARKLAQCQIQLIVDSGPYALESLRPFHEDCVQAAYDFWVSTGPMKPLSGKFPIDRQTVRAYDLSGPRDGYALTGKDRSLISNLLIENLRALVTDDMKEFLKVETAPLQSCSLFANHFVDWALKTAFAESALVSNGLLKTESDRGRYVPFLIRVCEARVRSVRGDTKAEIPLPFSIQNFRAALNERVWPALSPSI